MTVEELINALMDVRDLKSRVCVRECVDGFLEENPLKNIILAIDRIILTT